MKITTSREELSGLMERAAPLLTGLAAVATLFSIAAAQILLSMALLSLLLCRSPMQFPARLRFPLLAFIGWTLLSLAFSAAPLAGLSQVRKLFVFFILLVVYNAYRHRQQLWRVSRAMVLAGTLAALYGLGQFIHRYLDLQRQGLPFYENYVVKNQITGFMGHWMTFSGELMLVLLLLLASVLFLPWQGRQSLGWWLCMAPIGLALLASFTRGVWLGTIAGAAYLLVRFRPRLLWVLPLGILLLYLLAPPWLQERGQSIVDIQTDSSNRARLVMLRTGMEMIAAHPLFGVGPNRVEAEFFRYKPSSLPLPPAWYGHLHNNYMQLAAERGIPLLLIWLWLLYQVLREGMRAGRSVDLKTRMFGHAAVAATVGLMVAGLFEYNFGDSEVLMLYLFLISNLFAWSRLDSRLGPLEPEHLADAAHLGSETSQAAS